MYCCIRLALSSFMRSETWPYTSGVLSSLRNREFVQPFTVMVVFPPATSRMTVREP